MQNQISNDDNDHADKDDVDSCLSEDGDKSNDTDGLELPEGSELARLITKEQEEYCAAWGYLQKFSVNEDENDEDNMDLQEYGYGKDGPAEDVSQTSK